MLMLTMTACAYWNGTYMYVIDETGILKKAFERYADRQLRCGNCTHYKERRIYYLNAKADFR